jgi:predicted AAA+ superfamily ATPase
MIANICYNSSAPDLGLRLNMDRMTLKCYMADTGLLISHAFDENGVVSEEIYKKILFDKLETNLGMIMENIVAQMLVASGHKLYFYSNSSRDDAASRMKIDFLIAKSKISNRHNISPIEVKSSKHYTLGSLKKFRTKYAQQLHTPYVLHTRDVKEEGGITYLPLYMTGLL